MEADQAEPKNKTNKLYSLCLEVIERNYERIPGSSFDNLPTTVLQDFIAYAMWRRALGSYVLTGDNIYKLLTESLTILELRSFWLTDSAFANLRSLHLTHIDLRRCLQIGDGTLSILAERCPSLTTLLATGCHRISDHGVLALTRLTALTSLGLNLRSTLPDAFTALTQSCTNIQTLNLDTPTLLTLDNFKQIGESMQSLVELKVGLFIAFTMPNSELKPLQIYNMSVVDATVVQEIRSESNLRHLRELKLCTCPLVGLVLPTLPSLTLLKLKSLSKAKYLRGLPLQTNLTDLSIVRCRIAGLGEQIAPVAHQLTQFTLNEVKQITSEEISLITARLTTNLRHLTLYRMYNMDDTALIPMASNPCLTNVTLGWTNLRHTFIYANSVTKMNLEGMTQLIDQQLQGIVTACPKITWLCLRECQKLTDGVQTELSLSQFEIYLTNACPGSNYTERSAWLAKLAIFRIIQMSSAESTGCAIGRFGTFAVSRHYVQTENRMSKSE